MSVLSPNEQSAIEEEITRLGSEPFQPRPLIADIIRTRYCIPGSIFLVEGVDIFQASRSKRWRGVRLLLGDGELCIQALLASEMHRYVDRFDVAIGTYVKLESFALAHLQPHEEATVEHENGKATATRPSQVAYLTVDDLLVVGWNNNLIAMLHAEEAAAAQMASIDEESEVEDHRNEVEPVSGLDVARRVSEPDADLLEEVADADDDFEVMDIPQQKMTQKRAELAAHTSVSSDYSVPVETKVLPWSDVDPTKPLKLTPLRSIPNLPYKQNWSINVLAVVASVSDLQSSTVPPYSQRVARLAHPSTPKQVHLTVFLDAQEFTPCVGSVVLLLGVKNHRFDGGSLKKYDSDRPKNGGRWWFHDPIQFTWCDVRSLKTWWRQIHMR